MEVSKITELWDIYTLIDLYDSIDLKELIDRTDIAIIEDILEQANEVSMNSFNSYGEDFDINDYMISELINYLKRPTWLTIDNYCLECKKETPFKNNKDYILIQESHKNDNTYSPFIYKNNFFNTFLCTRCNHQEITYLFKIGKDKKLSKIWQSPSKVDLTIGDIKKYNKTLWEKYSYELKESIILNSHWFWIWAFVHLRRIFEYLIYETYNENKSNFKESEEEFRKLKMEKKIELLNKFLPSFLTEHKNIYWILSKHIHELEKEECSSNFEIVKWWIELILDQKIRLSEEKRKIEELSNWLNKIQQKI
jgi:hypothetical protein